ncbi:ribosomal protein S18-alanine N-acetyltransferase [Robiginitomaculum antarcticum]|uniref:ribosomal protein S18-alanine N-acetyltransferase n=1 Tax=Robiginitomaculum antarcticum TaxID=437507 RepID=UPI000373E822|nr:ribosomal protein S18-alanine N-acetyltransferase [Robiginitomaculum antarcticum]
MKCASAKLQDIAAITRIHAACFGAKAWPAEDFEAALSAPTDSLTVIYDDDYVAGFCHIRQSDDSAEILTFGVAPVCQDMGFGAALLIAALETTLKTGVEDILLDVRQDNRPAISLYRRAGFKRVGKRKNYYKDMVAGRPVYTDAHVYKKIMDFTAQRETRRA